MLTSEAKNYSALRQTFQLNKIFIMVTYQIARYIHLSYLSIIITKRLHYDFKSHVDYFLCG